MELAGFNIICSTLKKYPPPGVGLAYLWQSAGARAREGKNAHPTHNGDGGVEIWGHVEFLL